METTMQEGPYRVTDNSGSFTGRGWRLSGPDGGFEVYRDDQLKEAEAACAKKNAEFWKNADPREVRKLTREEQDKIMERAAALVEQDYAPGGALSGEPLTPTKPADAGEGKE